MFKEIAQAIGGDVVSGLFNADQASKNRRFQQQMSNTAYQRAAADLEKAGLNRILAIGSPASTPGGSVASMSGLGSTITQAAGTAQQISQSEQQEAKLFAETTGINMENSKKAVESEFWKAILPAVEQAAGSFEEFTKIVLSPEYLTKIQKAIEDTPGAIRGYIDQFLQKVIDKMPKNFSDLFFMTPVGMAAKAGNAWLKDRSKIRIGDPKNAE